MLLDDVSFRIGEGITAALVGPNGAGKTTLLRLVAGDIPPQSGTVVATRGLGGGGPFLRADPGRRGGRRRAGDDGARRRAGPAAVRCGPDRMGRGRRLCRRGALGRLLRRGP